MSILEIFQHFAKLIKDSNFISVFHIGCYNGYFLSLVDDNLDLFAHNKRTSIVGKIKESIPSIVFYTDKKELFNKSDFNNSFILFTESWFEFKENVDYLKKINKNCYYAFILPFGALETNLPFKTEKQIKNYLTIKLGLTHHKFFTTVLEYSENISYIIIQGEKNV